MWVGQCFEEVSIGTTTLPFFLKFFPVGRVQSVFACCRLQYLSLILTQTNLLLGLARVWVDHNIEVIRNKQCCLTFFPLLDVFKASTL